MDIVSNALDDHPPAEAVGTRGQPNKGVHCQEQAFCGTVEPFEPRVLLLLHRPGPTEDSAHQLPTVLGSDKAD